MKYEHVTRSKQTLWGCDSRLWQQSKTRGKLNLKTTHSVSALLPIGLTKKHNENLSVLDFYLYHGSASFHLWPMWRRFVTRCPMSNRWPAQLSAHCSPWSVRVGAVFSSAPLSLMVAELLREIQITGLLKNLSWSWSHCGHVSAQTSHMFMLSAIWN